jgi:exosortase A-associated hydrolase 1
MKRSFHQFQCEGEQLIGTLDNGSHNTGLLIVSGGNEIRAGAHSGMSKLAHSVSYREFPVFRFDRRGIGESSGTNHEFLSSERDIKAAAEQFRTACPNLHKIVAFGNCDAATALALFSPSIEIQALILANPWVIENKSPEPSEPNSPGAAAIRSRYWNRIKNPQSYFDLLTGKIDLSKLFKGLIKASKKTENSNLAINLCNALAKSKGPIDILLANKDTTALAFLAAWKSNDFATLRKQSNIMLSELDSASHSFADEKSKKWLEERVLESLHSA